jgi:PQQ-dependent catabolism-associated beta-propeller protein
MGASVSEAHEVYVSNEKDNSVSVIDTISLDVVRTFKVGRRPRGITFSRDFSQFYVCASDHDAVQVFDAKTDTHLYDLPSGRDPEQFALSKDGKRLYIANEDDAVTTIVDLEKRQVVKQVDVGVEPEGMAISPDDTIAVTTSETTNMAHLIDAKTYAPIDNILVDPRPRHAEFTPDGKNLWVSSEIGGTISIISLATKKIEKKISFSIPGVPPENIQPVGMILTADGKTAFAALGPAARVAVIDVETAKVTKYIVVGQRVWHMVLSPEEDAAAAQIDQGRPLSLGRRDAADAV